ALKGGFPPVLWPGGSGGPAHTPHTPLGGGICQFVVVWPQLPWGGGARYCLPRYRILGPGIFYHWGRTCIHHQRFQSRSSERNRLSAQDEIGKAVCCSLDQYQVIRKKNQESRTKDQGKRKKCKKRKNL